MKAVLRAVLHTILFSRTLGVVRPRDVDCDLFDLTYATCGDSGAGRIEAPARNVQFIPHTRPPPHRLNPPVPPNPAPPPPPVAATKGAFFHRRSEHRNIDLTCATCEDPRGREERGILERAIQFVPSPPTRPPPPPCHWNGALSARSFVAAQGVRPLQARETSALQCGLQLGVQRSNLECAVHPLPPPGTE